MSDLNRRLALVEKRAAEASGAVKLRVLWDNGDGTATDAQTGETIPAPPPGPAVIRLRWLDDDAGTPI